MNYTVHVLNLYDTTHGDATPYAIYPEYGPTSEATLDVEPGDTITFFAVREEPVIRIEAFNRFTDTGQFALLPFGKVGYDGGSRIIRVRDEAKTGEYRVDVTHEGTLGDEPESPQTHPPIIVSVGG